MNKNQYIEMDRKVKRYSYLEKSIESLVDAKVELMIKKVDYTETDNVGIKFKSEDVIYKFNRAVKDCINMQIDHYKKEMEEM